MAPLLAALAPATGLAQGLSFVEVSPANGLYYPQGQAGFTVGAAVGDVDADGWPDVLLYGGPVGVKLFRNAQDGTFVDATATWLPPDLGNVAHALFADFDGDRDPDLVLLRWHGTHVDTSVAWLIHDGVRYRWHETGGAITELARCATFSGTLTLGDVDGNGKLDVLRVAYTGPGWCLSQESYRAHYGQDPRVRFIDRSGRFAGNLGTSRRHWGGVLADFDGDGRQDLHCAVDQAPDYQARNLGGGVFADVSLAANVTHVGSDMGIAVGDIDEDGDQDIFSTNIEHHVLYVNDGAGRFTDEAAARGVRQNATPTFDWGWGTVFSDLDNDGDLDLAVVDSGGGMICLNDGTGHFLRDDSGHGAVLTGLGLLAFDYDRDGDEDLLSTGRLGFAKLWQNVSAPATGRHWLRVDLRGRSSNPAGIGARVFATVNGVRRMREVVAGQSFMCGPPLTVHFGLGDATAVDLLEIHWPSGGVDLYAAVPGDGHVIAVEGIGALTRL